MKKIRKIRSLLLEFFTHKAAVPFLLSFRKNKPFHYSMDDLEKFPEGTLGKDLVNHLRKNNFVLLKKYERHDCKHLILGYDMDELGEASMQFYVLGTRSYSFPVIITVLVCTVIMPDYWKIFYQEFKKGRKGIKMNELDYNELVHLNTIDLQTKYKAA